MRTKSILVVVMVALLFSLTQMSFATTASFQGLGALAGGTFESYGEDVSADGSVVVGWSLTASGWQGFCWTQSGGMESLSGNFQQSLAYGISADGKVIVGGGSNESGYTEAFRWTESGGFEGLGDVAGGSFESYAYDVSADGTVIAARGRDGFGHEACRWTAATGMQSLTETSSRSLAYGISANGRVIAGEHNGQGFRWTQSGGMEIIGGHCCEGVSADGSVVVGRGNFTSGWGAFRWTQSGGIQELGDLPGGNYNSYASDVSADGSFVVGKGTTDLGSEAFIWDAINGMRNFKVVLENDYGLDLTGWQLANIKSLSGDGLTFVGTGYNPSGYIEAYIATISQPSTPPVADADGPYIIEVGDMLTLDANGSTDADNDIVSYMWDLDDDDDGTFETDAGGQAVFDVNFAYLQSLGLLVDHTYNIHVQVTDSEGQSDVNDSTLIIIPKPATVVAVDIKPGSCPNPVNVKSSGVLPVAILGTEDVNVLDIVPTSIRLAGVEPLRSGYEDVATPVWDTNDCNCITDGPDGFLDLTLKFETQKIVEVIGDVNDGDVLTLELTGVLFGERPIEGADCILIRGRHKPINPADINKDGVVNAADFAIIAENWLQSSIVWD